MAKNLHIDMELNMVHGMAKLGISVMAFYNLEARWAQM
jgi:hypothetical protein